MKLTILQSSLPHYRISFFEQLSKKYDLTVCLFEECYIKRDVDFDVVNFGRSSIRSNFKCLKYIKNSNTIIIIGDHLRKIFLPFFRIIPFLFNKPIIWWGVSADPTRRLFCFLKRYLFKANDFLIFYDYGTLNVFLNMFPYFENKVIVANNTVAPPSRSPISFTLSSFGVINVGSLVSRKNNAMLINVVFRMLNAGYDVKLTLAGDGPDLIFLQQQVSSLGITDHVDFCGEIVDDDHLFNLYANSSISVSYGQCGLALLQSFSYGRAFLTCSNAVTGGESSNLISGFNGYFIRDESELYDYLVFLYQNPKYLEVLNSNALLTYSTLASFDQHVESFVKAIDNFYILNSDFYEFN